MYGSERATDWRHRGLSGEVENLVIFLVPRLGYNAISN
jgi:hypothetical protein